MKIYYLHFKPDADVNYLHLFSLYDLADYNPATKAYDTINYTSIPKLAALLPYSAATLKLRDGCDGCNGENDTVRATVAIVATVAERIGK